MRIGIAIDDWKLPTFQKYLKKTGYTYEQGEGLTPNTFMLYVTTDNPLKLQKVVEKCQNICAASNAG